MQEDKIKQYIDEKFKQIYAISMFYQTYLIGGSIIDIMLNHEARDLDFLFLCNNSMEANKYLKKFIEKNGFTYSMNHFNGYKINYNGIEVDLWHTNDIFNWIEYNADGILYDVENKRLISISFNDYLKNGPRKINETLDNNSKSEKRLIKLQNRYKEFKDKGW